MNIGEKAKNKSVLVKIRKTKIMQLASWLRDVIIKKRNKNRQIKKKKEKGRIEWRENKKWTNTEMKDIK